MTEVLTTCPTCGLDEPHHDTTAHRLAPELSSRRERGAPMRTIDGLVRVRIVYAQPIGTTAAVIVFLRPGEEKTLPCGSVVRAEVFTPTGANAPPSLSEPLSDEALAYGREVAERLKGGA
jgi:hypothetical protein